MYLSQKAAFSLNNFLISRAFLYLSLACFLDFFLIFRLLQADFLIRWFLIKKTKCNIRRWTKSVNIFEKSLVIFPVGTGTHWYLIAAVRPGDVLVKL